MGGTVYPGLMLTANVMYWFSNLLGFTVHIKDVCVFTAPIFSGFTACATYLLTKELWSAGAGLFAAAFISIAPGYISRSVAGSYDNEGIAIFALQDRLFKFVVQFLERDKHEESSAIMLRWYKSDFLQSDFWYTVIGLKGHRSRRT